MYCEVRNVLVHVVKSHCVDMLSCTVAHSECQNVVTSVPCESYQSCNAKLARGVSSVSRG